MVLSRVVNMTRAGFTDLDEAQDLAETAMTAVRAWSMTYEPHGP